MVPLKIDPRNELSIKNVQKSIIHEKIFIVSIVLGI